MTPPSRGCLPAFMAEKRHSRGVCTRPDENMLASSPLGRHAADHFTPSNSVFPRGVTEVIASTSRISASVTPLDFAAAM